MSNMSHVDNLGNRKGRFHFLEFGKSKMVVLWENCNKHIANSMRRIMQTEIPTMAIHIVHVFENTSVMTDEMIVHRLGLLPLHSETVDNFLFAKECPCSSRQCKNCSVSIDLHFTCFDDFANVTSRDLMCSDANVYPVHDSTLPQDVCDGTESILLAKLKQHQQLHIKCIARKGIGLNHAKWSPVVAISERHCPVPSVDHQLVKYLASRNTTNKTSKTATQNNRIIAKNRLKHNPINGELEIIDADAEEADSSGSTDVVNFDNEVSLFVIETNGSLSPASVMLQSVQLLKRRVCVLLHELDNMKVEEY